MGCSSGSEVNCEQAEADAEMGLPLVVTAEDTCSKE